ncbi:hypothetical protein T492DRAFT_850222 [Pavlovales sp. CCMP2436]|nr:hypothetical protein T492DRAFT_850222 [Pavlovales sp. CCMP2436]
MCVNTDLQRIIEINAGIIARGKCHKTVKTTLFEKYIYGDVSVIGHYRDKFVLEGRMIDPITNDVIGNLHFEANEKRIYIIMDSCDDYCGEEVIEEGPTPLIITQLMYMQAQNCNPWI